MASKRLHYDRKIKDWQIISITLEGSEHRFVRGIILEDRTDEFFEGHVVCSSPLVGEFSELKIVTTRDNRYKLVGIGEYHKSNNIEILLHLRRGMCFHQASLLIYKEQKRRKH